MKLRDLLDWKDKGVSATNYGICRIFEGVPTEIFWQKWRINKSWFEQQQVRVRQITTKPGAPKKYLVNWYKPEVETPLQKAAREASRRKDSTFRFPLPKECGITPYPYQRAGVEYLLTHCGDRALLGDDMGLGKTLQFIGYTNVTKPETILILCPASLIRNWEKEFKKFSTLGMKINRVEKAGDFPLHPEIVICSHDSAYRDWLKVELHGRKWGAIGVDEAHKLCNEETQRSRAILGGSGKKTGEEFPALKADSFILITGTPVTSRVFQSWNLFRFLWPDEFGNSMRFAMRYCEGSMNGGKLRATGASNLGELQDRLRSKGMVRRRKVDVLTELPPKVRQVIELPAKPDMVLNKASMEFELSEKTAEEMEARIELAEASGDEDALKHASLKLKEARKVAFDAIARVRAQTAKAKIPLVVKAVKDALEGGVEKIVVGAHHAELIDALMVELKGFKPVRITGKDSKAARDLAVTTFQSDPGCRVAVLSILAAGVGLTLTAASYMILAEIDWVPANMIQFEDRIHRIGQTSSTCFYQYLVLEDSLDARMVNACVKKLDIYKAMLDDETGDMIGPEPMAETITRDQGGDIPEGKPRADYKELGKLLDYEDCDVALSVLKYLSSLDNDRASVANGIGFSSYDSTIGHDLAKRDRLFPAQAALGFKLIHKYRSQLVGHPATDRIEKAKSKIGIGSPKE